MVTTAKKPIAYQAYIDGKWVDAQDGSTFNVVNPATEEVIGSAPNSGRDEMKRAIAAARNWPGAGWVTRQRLWVLKYSRQDRKRPQQNPGDG